MPLMCKMSSPSQICVAVLCVLTLGVFGGCEGAQGENPVVTAPPATVSATQGLVTFSDLRAQIKTACSDCHETSGDELSAGAFLYVDTYRSGRTELPGLFEAAFDMESALDGFPKQMPKGVNRGMAPKTLALVRAWIAAGRPEGSFPFDPTPLAP